MKEQIQRYITWFRASVFFAGMIALAGCGQVEVRLPTATVTPQLNLTVSLAEIPPSLTPTKTEIPPTTTETITPSRTPLPSPVVLSVTAGESHSCALISDCTVQCWGKNAYGQLGDGTTEEREEPRQVEGLENVQTLAAGWGHTCAVTAEGAVLCWGYNRNGELGDGTTRHSSVPVYVKGLSGAVNTIAAGDDHTCVVTNAGQVQCWGFNEIGQLGDGTTLDRNSAVNVVGLEGVRSMAAGWGHTCALSEAGSVYCWGSNEFGQLGVDTEEEIMPTPVVVDALGEWVQAITAKGGHTCALITNGEVQCWGVNTYGQLGDGTTEDQDQPGPVRGLRGVQALAAGWNHTCAIVADGGMKCWGWNYLGQLGDQTRMTQVKPVSVTHLQEKGLAMWLGWRHTCAVTDTGQIACWGENEDSEGWNDWLLAQVLLPDLLADSPALAVVQDPTPEPFTIGSSTSTPSVCPPFPTPSVPMEGQYVGLVFIERGLEDYGYTFRGGNHVEWRGELYRIEKYESEQDYVIFIERNLCYYDEYHEYIEVIAEFIIPPLADDERVNITCRSDLIDEPPDLFFGVVSGYDEIGFDSFQARRAWVVSFETMVYEQISTAEIGDVYCRAP